MKGNITAFAISIAVVLTVCISAAASAFAAGGDGVYAAPDDLSGRIVGVQTGSTDEIYVKDRIPDAKLEYFSTLTDEINALKAKKIDGIAASEAAIYELVRKEDDITVIEEPIGSFPCAFVFAAILKTVVDRLTKSIEPEKRSEAKILKGIQRP